MASVDQPAARFPEARRDWAEPVRRWRLLLNRRLAAYGVALTQHPGVAADYLAASGREPDLAEAFLRQRRKIRLYF